MAFIHSRVLSALSHEYLRLVFAILSEGEEEESFESSCVKSVEVNSI